MTTYHPDVSTDAQNGADNGSIRERSKEQLAAGQQKAKDALDTARTQATETASRASEQSVQFVRDNPALALAGAAAVGALIGMALRGRD